MSVEVEAKGLADYLPNGRPFEAKYTEGTNLRALLQGFAGELCDVDTNIGLFGSEFFPGTTTDYIEEWEKAVGLPDHCIPTVAGTLEERRANVIIKLVSSGLQTEPDFLRIVELLGGEVNLQTNPDPYVFPYSMPLVFSADPVEANSYIGELFGGEIKIRTGCEVATYPHTFPLIFIDTPADARYLWYVEYDIPVTSFFPYPFGVIFGDKVLAMLKCLFDKYKPANTQVIFRKV